MQPDPSMPDVPMQDPGFGDGHQAHRDASPGVATDATSAPIARLLLCDDSPVERMALAHLLRRTGYRVDEAGDGESTLSHLKHRPVDLLLLDLNMPDVDGFDVLAYLQQHRPGLPVILLSGMPLDQIQHKMHRLPTPELPPLFLKPVDPDQLLQVLDLKLRGELPERLDDVREGPGKQS